jgi:biotin transporter BioY
MTPLPRKRLASKKALRVWRIEMVYRLICYAVGLMWLAIIWQAGEPLSVKDATPVTSWIIRGSYAVIVIAIVELLDPARWES